MQVGSRVGRYRITGILGEGGMGKVYAGFDETLRREVALKTWHRDRMDDATRARHLREARALSQLAHPNICTIHELVEHEDGDLLVLESISGSNLREALDGGIEPALKLPIAQQICAALAAAHAKGIIHRDLKLANVMLTDDGVVKVLDFGLARTAGEREEPASGGAAGDPAAANLTELGSVVGTMTCMSPEQARGEVVTSASDLYSFGLLLQELFAGASPYPKDLPPALMKIRVRDGDTLPVTGVDRDLAALLERMKALAPAARPTAEEVSRRLRWIAGKPRRRLGWAAAAAVTLLLVAGTVKFTLDLRRERDLAVAAREEAEQARLESDQVAKFLEEVFRVSDPNQLGQPDSLTARDLLDRASTRIRGELVDQPLVRARLMSSMGRIYFRLGLYDKVRPLFEEALRERERVLGPRHLDVALSLEELAVLNQAFGEPEAEPRFRRALEIREAIQGPDDPAVAKILMNLGVLFASTGQLETAKPLITRALAIRERHPDDPVNLALALHNLGGVYLDQGRLDRAEPLLRRALTIRRGALPPDHPELVGTLSAMGMLLLAQERFDDALALQQEARAAWEKRLGPEHPLVALALYNVGEIQVRLGKPAEAEASFRRAIAIREKVLGPGARELVAPLRALAGVCRAQGRVAEGDVLIRKALAVAERALPPDSPELRELREDPAAG